MDKVELHWTGPFTYDNARQSEEGKNVGVYAITVRQGSHPERILRIGQAYYQNFLGRLAGYRTSIIAQPGSCHVRFGKFISRISIQRLNDVESLLIYAYQPKWNELGKDCYDGRDLEIRNLGRHGPISSIVKSLDC